MSPVSQLDVSGAAPVYSTIWHQRVVDMGPDEDIAAGKQPSPATVCAGAVEVNTARVRASDSDSLSNRLIIVI